MHLFQGVADLSRALDLPLLVAASDVENRRAVGVQMGGFTCDRVEADFGKEPRREKDCFVLIVEAASGGRGFRDLVGVGHECGDDRLVWRRVCRECYSGGTLALVDPGFASHRQNPLEIADVMLLD
jgi:hypothetical protein